MLLFVQQASLSGFPDQDKLSPAQLKLVKSLANDWYFVHSNEHFEIRVEKMKGDELINPVIIYSKKGDVGKIVVADSMKLSFNDKGEAVLTFDKATFYGRGSFAILTSDFIKFNLP